MAVYKRVQCADCGKQLCQTAKETSKEWQAKTCSCGGSPKLSSNWYVSTYLPGSDGKLHKVVKAVGPSKKDAEAKERELLTKRDEGEKYEARKDGTLNGFMEEWQEWIDRRFRDGKLAAGSKLYYERRTDRIKPYFGRLNMRDITPETVEAYIDFRRDTECRPATINREVATLKRILAVAVQKRIIKYHPLQGLEMLAEDNERDRHLTAAEVDALIQACVHPLAPPHLLPIVVVGLNTGLRIDGVLTLRWEEIKWRENEIHKIVKGKKQVRIPMSEDLKDCLTQWRIHDGVQKVAGWVFPSTRKSGEHMLITSQFGFTTALKRANIKDCTFHTLRHTFATMFLEQFPEHMETLRVILGHSSSYITRRYAHLTDRTKHSTMAAFKVA
jgi:integrase